MIRSANSVTPGCEYFVAVDDFWRTRSARTKCIEAVLRCSLTDDARNIARGRCKTVHQLAKKGLRSRGAEASGIGLTRSSEGKYRAFFCQSPATLYIECYPDSVRSACW